VARVAALRSGLLSGCLGRSGRAALQVLLHDDLEQLGLLAVDVLLDARLIGELLGGKLHVG